MKATILIINFGDHEEMTLHDTDGMAWAKLIQFVEREWNTILEGRPPPADETERVRMFFARDEDGYVIAEADLNDIADALDRPGVTSQPHCPK